jgi:hypothetical protein
MGHSGGSFREIGRLNRNIGLSMKLTATGQHHPSALGSEVILFATATEAGMRWQPAASGVNSAMWERNERVMIDGLAVPGLLGNRGASLRIDGKSPLLLVLSHPWSGHLRMRVGLRAAEVDLYNPRTRVLLLDAAAGVAVQVDPHEVFSGERVAGVAQGALEVMPRAVLLGRPFYPVGSNLAATTGGRIRRARGHRAVLVAFRQIFATLLAPLGLVPRSTIREDLLLAIMDGLVRRGTASPASERPAESDLADATAASQPDLGHQVAVLTAIIEGMSSRVDQMARLTDSSRVS